MGKRWNRKNRGNSSNHKRNKGGGDIYDRRHNKHKAQKDGTFWQTNRKLEAYYAYQGLHSTYFDDESKSFRSCLTDEQKEQERQRWMETQRKVLPASFRIGVDIDPILRDRIKKEIEDLVGKEMEITIDPNGGKRARSATDRQQKQQEKKTEENGEAQNGGGDDDDNTTKAGDTKMDTTEPESADAMKVDPQPETKTNDSELMVVKLAPAKPIPFIPHAYQLSIDRTTIRRNPGLRDFFKWLMIHTEAGFITRQETVSMIPPVVLSVEPHHKVLDMCAAPGSKTTQILEIVSAIPKGAIEPVGCVVANDADPKRAYMLVHQIKRLCSPAALVVSCDAQFFPVFNKDDPEGKEGVFDRVLCDVPCSGDGTMRKNPGVWKNWTAGGGHSLHSLQLSIALNGARVCKVGGLICYSTCSQNPIENEAVVAEILRSTDGALELVDKRPDLEGLLARPGMTTWKVLVDEKTRREEKNIHKKRRRQKEWAENEKKKQKEGKEPAEGKTDDEKAAEDATETAPNDDGKNENGADATGADKVEESTETTAKPFGNNVPLEAPTSWDEETLRNVTEAEGMVEYTSFDEIENEKHKGRLRQSSFPPTKEELEWMGLEKCMRCLAHDMNTGGFFVALFKKVKPLSQRARQRSERLAAEFSSKKDETEPTPKTKETPAAANAEEAKEAKDETKGGDDTVKPKAESSGTTPAEGSSTDVAAPDGDGKVQNLWKRIDDKYPGAKQEPAKKSQGNFCNENFVNNEALSWAPLEDFYGFKPNFPKDQIMSRTEGNSKQFSFVSKSVRELMNLGIQKRLIIINTGLKALAKNSESQVDYRVCQQAIPYIVSYMTAKRKIECTFEDFESALSDGHTTIGTFSKGVSEPMMALSLGAFVLIMKGYENDIAKKMMLIMWRARGDKVNCLVNKAEKDGIRRKLKAFKDAGATGAAVVTGTPMEEDNDEKN